MQIKKQQLELDIKLVQNWERNTSRLYTVTLHKLICRVHHGKRWGGWITSWDQDCWEKYQPPQICRWHHPYGRKTRGTKEPLDENQRGEWKSWLKTQHSKNEDHGIWSHHFKANRWGKKWKQWQILFSWVPKSLQMVTVAMKLRHLLLGRKIMTNLDSILESGDITLLTKVSIVKAMAFFQ